MKAGCVIGRDYPAPIVNHNEACKKNVSMMEELKQNLLRKLQAAPEHCGPSSEEETRIFMGFDKNCSGHSHAAGEMM